MMPCQTYRAGRYKFPVLKLSFPVIASETPCSVAQGIQSENAIASALFENSGAAGGQVLQKVPVFVPVNRELGAETGSRHTGFVSQAVMSLWAAALPPCWIGSKHVRRRIIGARAAKAWHSVKLMPPSYLKAYLKRSKITRTTPQRSASP